MKKIILVALGLLILLYANAQNNDNMWSALKGDASSWDSICQSYDAYISQTYGDSIPDSVLSSYKNYLRYKYIWGSRLGISEGEPSYTSYTEAAINNLLDPICDDGDTASWEVMGPVSYPTQWLGLVDEVLYDPLYPERIIISSDRGGIWVREYDSIGWGWHNVTDQLRLPGLCASEIIRNPFVHDQDCDATQKTVLYNIVDNAYGNLQMSVRNILTNTDSLRYNEPYILPGEGLKENKIRRVPVRKYYKEDSFKLYPNPAGNYVIIKYTLQGDMPKGLVNILDNKGMVVKSIALTKSNDYLVVETNDLPSGIYYCNFVIESIHIQTEKLIIIH
jgi:hypothetical protein